MKGFQGFSDNKDTQIEIAKALLETNKIRESLIYSERSGPERIVGSCYKDILVTLRKSLTSGQRPGDNIVKKAFSLLCHSRSSILTKSQLKASCLSRLNVFLSDEQADTIFNELDKNREGTIKVRALVSAIIGVENGNTCVNMPYQTHVDRATSRNGNGDERRNKKYQLENDVVEPSLNSMTLKFQGLKCPTRTIQIPIKELEQMIFDKVTALTTSKSLVHSMGTLFGDYKLPSSAQPWLQAHQRDNSAHTHGNYNYNYHGIDRNQMKYSLWKKLQIPVSEEMIEKIFLKYDPSGTGYIPMQSWIKGIIGNEAERMQLRPVIEDMKSTAGLHACGSNNHSNKMQKIPQYPKVVVEFLHLLRQEFRNMINREYRAPHYLLGIVNRMTFEQAREFFTAKLHVCNFTEQLFAELMKVYQLGGLLDVKGLLQDVFSISSGSELGPDMNLLNGSGVTVDQLPATLRGAPSLSPGNVERILYDKMRERGSSAQMHRYFMEPGHENSRTLSKKGLFNVLRMFDIFLSTQDFESLFQTHDRGDGLIDVRSFVDKITPKFTFETHPMTPKDDQVLKKEYELARQLHLLTGKCQQVSALNGPSGSAGLSQYILSNLESIAEVEVEDVSSKGDLSNNVERKSLLSRQSYDRHVDGHASYGGWKGRPLPSSQLNESEKQQHNLLTSTNELTNGNVTNKATHKRPQSAYERGQGQGQGRYTNSSIRHSRNGPNPEKYISEALKQRIMTELLALQKEKRAEVYTQKSPRSEGSQGSHSSLSWRFANTEGSSFDQESMRDGLDNKRNGDLKGRDMFESSAPPPMPYTFVYSPRSQAASSSNDNNNDFKSGNISVDALTCTSPCSPPTLDLLHKTGARSRSRDKKFVDCGQSWTVTMDPFHRTLMTRYKATHENMTQSSQAYGLFIDCLNDAKLKRKALEEEYKEAKANAAMYRELRQSIHTGSSPRRPATAGGSPNRSSPKKNFIKL